MMSDFENGSDNTFKDLGFSDPEAEHLLIRSQLMVEVEKYVERSGMTQREAAKKLGITQPRLNDLLQGRIQRFSIDALVKVLAKIGLHVDVHVRVA